MLTETIYNYWLSVVYVGVNTLSDLVHRHVLYISP